MCLLYVSFGGDVRFGRYKPTKKNKFRRSLLWTTLRTTLFHGSRSLARGQHAPRSLRPCIAVSPQMHCNRSSFILFYFGANYAIMTLQTLCKTCASFLGHFVISFYFILALSEKILVQLVCKSFVLFVLFYCKWVNRLCVRERPWWPICYVFKATFCTEY